MLKPFQKAYLKSLANPISNRYLLGKGGIDDSFVKMISEALEAHELIKIGLLQSVEEKPAVVAKELADALDAEVVQIIGKVIVLYRKSSKNPKIVIPTRD